jgi:hypothetical protein
MSSVRRSELLTGPKGDTGDPGPSAAMVTWVERAGTVTATPGTARFAFPANVTIDDVMVMVDTAPSGADLIVDVHKNGVTVFTTQANRPKIVAGAHASAAAVPDVLAVVAGDYLTVNVDQVGSATPGSDLVAAIRWHV